MGANTKIEWCDHTFNPWIGCQRVSPGCVNCYAEHTNTYVRVQRAGGNELWGPKGARHVTSDANWRKPLAWNRLAAGNRTTAWALDKVHVRPRVFCASLADVFEDRPDLVAPRARLFALIQATPELDWLLLTKRPENMVRLAQASGWEGDWPANVWAGCTVEDQQRADERIAHLLAVPAAVRFLSCEPLLGPVDLKGSLYRNGMWVDPVKRMGESAVARLLKLPSDAHRRAVLDFFCRTCGRHLPDAGDCPTCDDLPDAYNAEHGR
ncbi:DUF5131 family protein [Longimicrobium sp.]|jgi:protein gp37|uniref:DUF5131 family protein n=1 Tax=Longimicrobium sp. TaxID=2029185 RepID=UPI002F922C97